MGLIALYYLWIVELPCLPWCLNIAIIAVPFIAIGYHSYKYILHFSTLGGGRNLISLIISISIFTIIVKTINPQVNMKENAIPSFYLFYPIAILGSIMILSLSQIIIRTLKKVKVLVYLQYIGKNSLIIMCIHEPIKRISLMIASKISHIPIENIRNDLGLSIGITIIIILICTPFIYIICHYFPWIIGKNIKLFNRENKINKKIS